jgi:hypothetical protein
MSGIRAQGAFERLDGGFGATQARFAQGHPIMAPGLAGAGGFLLAELGEVIGGGGRLEQAPALGEEAFEKLRCLRRFGPSLSRARADNRRRRRSARRYRWRPG